MHQKSIEAAEKLKEEGDSTTDDSSRNRDELRSESIAALRAKAQEHSAKVMEAIGSSSNNNNTQSANQTHGGTAKNIRHGSVHAHSHNQYGGIAS